MNKGMSRKYTKLCMRTINNKFSEVSTSGRGMGWRKVQRGFQLFIKCFISQKKNEAMNAKC